LNVLFLNPPFHNRFSRESRSPAVTKSGTLYFPKWLSHAAGVAIQAGHIVDLIDAPAAGHSVDYVIDRIRAKNVKAVVCETSTPSIVNDVRVVDALKAKLPNIRICLVGRHVSALPEQTLGYSDKIDAITLREYDYTVRDWLAAMECGADLSGVTGMMWRNSRGEVVRNKERPAIANLDELPFVTEVYKRFLRIEDYFYGHSLHPLVVFDTSRGCPYKCSFCVYPQTFSGHAMRYRSAKHVADEFEFVARELPQVKTVMLEDDTFIIHKKRTIELAEELIRRGNKLPFDSNCRVDVGVDAEFLKLLHKAGARLFCVGFESGDVSVIRHMHKNNNRTRDDSYVQTAMRFADCCRQAGIILHGCFMFGNLNETRETMRTTLDFAKKVDPDTAQFFPIMVYPGTAAYEEAKARGLLATEDYSHWLTPDGLHNSVINLPGLTHKDLVDFSDQARREFYLRPRYIARKLRQSLLDAGELKRNLKGFAKLLKYLIHGSDTRNIDSPAGGRENVVSGHS
jgi:anaerobic magnesium-protoporphyrin IX monomethyl ester cyclase